MTDISDAVENVRAAKGGHGLRRIAAFRANEWGRKARGADGPGTARHYTELSDAWRRVAGS